MFMSSETLGGVTADMSSVASVTGITRGLRSTSEGSGVLCSVSDVGGISVAGFCGTTGVVAV